MTDTNTAEREALMDLIDAYAEARHVGGCHTYNAKTAEARAKVVASLAASEGADCERCSGSGEDPEGFYDQSRGDAGHTHEGPCRSCGGSGVAASAGSEPMFWVRLLRDGLYEGPVHHKSVGGKMLRDEKPGEWTPLYTHHSPPEGMAGWIDIATPPMKPDANVAFESTTYLVTDGTSVSTCDFARGNGAGKPWASWSMYGGIPVRQITHWMPTPALPAPPLPASAKEL